MPISPQDRHFRLCFEPCEIMCPRCGTIHLISPRTPPDVLDQLRLRMRCAHCGKCFSVRQDLEILPRLIPQRPHWDE